MVQQTEHTHDTVTVLNISDTEWRVSDPERREDDARCLVGFVQQFGDVFEAMWISRPRERHYFGSLQAAIYDLAGRRA
jgi:hypothetical protein